MHACRAPEEAADTDAHGKVLLIREGFKVMVALVGSASQVACGLIHWWLKASYTEGSGLRSSAAPHL